MNSKDFDDLLYNNEFMERAVREALKSEAENGIPIGSVIIKDGEIIGSAHNRRVQENNPIMHAEFCCIQNSVKKFMDLKGSTLYTTHMPCFLCAGAIIQFGVSKVIAGESKTFPHARYFLEKNGVEVVDLDLVKCKAMLQNFIADNPKLWEGVSKNNFFNNKDVKINKLVIPYKQEGYANFYQYPPPMQANAKEKQSLIKKIDLDKEMPDKKEFTLFISIPYCRIKCNSCHFFKNPTPSNSKIIKVLDDYLPLIIKQIKNYSATVRFSRAYCNSVYIGGGTASLLSSNQLRILINEIKTFFKLKIDSEITLEGNPLDLNEKHLYEVKNMGINRLSVGLQSFKEEILKKSLNCSHSGKIGVRMIKNALKLGFKTVNADFLYGIPGQKKSDWRSDIKKIIKISPQNITTYRYIIHPNSVSKQLIDKGLLEKQANEKEIFKLYLWAYKELIKAGYRENRFGCFYKPGHIQRYSDSSYNLSYESIGIGAGAYSFINGYVFRSSDNVEKFKSDIECGLFQIGDYISAESTEKNKMERYVINNLFSGILERDKFKNIFKQDSLEVFPLIFAKLCRYNLVTIDNEFIKLTVLGKRYIQNVLYEFYAEELKSK